ncbi:MAG TPA: hypothetical protein VK609_07335 [Mucilaginibacter sp.]|nr:hypothetical protein [Mucilaginibacter sp.]
MNVKPLIVIGAGAGLLYILSNVSKASAVSNLAYRISGIKPGWIGITPTLDLTVMVGNTSNQAFSVNALQGNVYVNNLYAGQVSSYTKTMVLPTSEVPYKLTVRLGLAGIAKQIIDIIGGKAAVAVNVRLNGTTNVDGLIFPVDISYNII